MVEPVTIASVFTLYNLTAAAVGGVVGNRVDGVFCSGLRRVVNNLKALESDPTRNHDLQRAARKAYLTATAIVVAARLEAKGYSGGRLAQLWRRTTPADDAEVSWLDKANRALAAEFKQLNDPRNLPHFTQDDERIRLLLQPRGVTAAARVRELRGESQREVLAELQNLVGTELDPYQPLSLRATPDSVRQMIEHGWQETGLAGVSEERIAGALPRAAGEPSGQARPANETGSACSVPASPTNSNTIRASPTSSRARCWPT